MRTQRILLAAALAITALVYWVGLNGPLLFDDNQNLAPLNEWLQGRLGWMSAVFGNRAGMFGRWLSMASFVLNIELLGTATWGLKLGNLIVHLANGVAVFALFQAFLRAKALVAEPTPPMRWLPLLGAAAWMLHPLLVSTVLYVVQRMAMLSALFVLLAMLSYLHGRFALIERRSRRAALLLLVAAPLCAILAVFSKENGVLALPLCAAIEWIAFRPAAGARRPLWSTAFVFSGLALPAIIAVGLVAIDSPTVMRGYANRSFTLTERLLTQSRVLWDYVGSILLPYGPRMGLFHDDYPISRGLLDPLTTAFALLGWLVALGAAWWARRKAPGVALGLAVFLVGQSLESSIFPLLNYFEHRNYLPSIGIVWALLSLVSYAGQHAGRHMHHGGRVAVFAATSIVVALALATAARASIWQTKHSILAQALTFHPQSRWLRMELAAESMERTPPDLAGTRLQLETLLRSTDPSTQKLGATARLIVDCGNSSPARPELVKIAFDGRPEPLEADLLNAYERLSEGVKASPCKGLTALQMADRLSAMLDRSRLPPGDQSIWHLRLKAAYLYLAAGRIDEALRQAMLSHAGGTSDPQVAVFAADLMIRQGDLQNAMRMLDAAATQLKSDDIAGHQVIQAYRSHVARLRGSATKSSP